MKQLNIFRPNNVQVRPNLAAAFDDSVILYEDIQTKEGIQQVEKRVSSREYAESLSLPNALDFTLQNQLSSGVPLREVPVSGLLSPDPLSDAGVSIGAEATSSLQKEMEKESETN